GNTGGAGPTGPTGPAVYLDGDSGPEGDPGPPGPPGPTGGTGATGTTGATGAQGPVGPIMFLDDGPPGDDGAPGPAGPAGAAGTMGSQGLQGPTGPLLLISIPEDGADGDVFLIPGPTGPAGATGATGTTGASGTGSGGMSGYFPYSLEDGSVDNDAGAIYQQPIQGFNGWLEAPISIYGPYKSAAGNSFGLVVSAGTNASDYGLRIIANGSTALTVSGTGTTVISTPNSNIQAFQVYGPAGGAAYTAIFQAGASNEGINILAGSGSSDVAINVVNQNSSLQLMRLWGDGGLTLGPVALKDEGVGTVNLSNGYYVNGVPIAQATVGQTHAAFMLADDTSNDDGFALPYP